MEKGLPDDFLDCDRCPDTLARRALGCGWLPESERVASDRPFPEASVCPGYTTRLPEVMEAARAMSWTKRGGLVPLYGNERLPPVAIDAIDVLEGACNEAERDAMRAQREEMTRGTR